MDDLNVTPWVYRYADTANTITTNSTDTVHNNPSYGYTGSHLAWMDEYGVCWDIEMPESVAEFTMTIPISIEPEEPTQDFDTAEIDKYIESLKKEVVTT